MQTTYSLAMPTPQCRWVSISELYTCQRWETIVQRLDFCFNLCSCNIVYTKNSRMTSKSVSSIVSTCAAKLTTKPTVIVGRTSFGHWREPAIFSGHHIIYTHRSILPNNHDARKNESVCQAKGNDSKHGTDEYKALAADNLLSQYTDEKGFLTLTPTLCISMRQTEFGTRDLLCHPKRCL